MKRTYQVTTHTLAVPPDEKNRPAITRQDIFPDGAAFVLRNVLSPAECRNFIHQAEQLGLEDCGYSPRIRKTDRVAATSDAVAKLLFERIQPFLEPYIDLSIEQRPIGIPNAVEPTKWIPTGLNECFRICRYEPGGFFLPHWDGGFARSRDDQSLKTFMLYLNGDFEGGPTNFFNGNQRHYQAPLDKNIVDSFQPREAGDALVFNSQITHDGGQVTGGHKYILRSEIMYSPEQAALPELKPDHDDNAEFTWP